MNTILLRWRFFSFLRTLLVVLVVSLFLWSVPVGGWGRIHIEKLNNVQSKKGERIERLVDLQEDHVAGSPFFSGNSVLGKKSLSLLWPQQTLGSIEAKWHPTSERRLSAARLEESLALLEYSQSRGFSRFSFHARVGHYQERPEASNIKEYDKMIAGGTLSYPLLGSYAKKESEILVANVDVEEKRLLAELSLLEGIQSLRAHYINYWCAAEQIALSEAFLAHEEKVGTILTNRTHTAHLLAADREEFLTTFAAARRDIAVAKAVIQRSIRGIRLFTTRDLPLFRPSFPQLPEAQKKVRSWAGFQAYLIAHHPRLRLLRNRVEKQLKLLRINKNEWVNGAVDLEGYAARSELDSGNEYGLSMNVRLDLPLQWSSVKDSARAARLAALKTSQAELDVATAKILEAARDTYDHLVVYDEQVTFSRQRLKAALESLREKVLRAENISGDSLERIEQGRYNYYRIAMDYLEALRRELQTRNRHISILSFPRNGGSSIKAERSQPKAVKEDKVPQYIASYNDSYQSNSLRAPLRVMPEVNKKLEGRVQKSGFYVWKSRKLLEYNRQELWQMLHEIEVNSLLVSFDAAQIAEFQGVDFTQNIKKWVNFIHQAADNGIAVELLLGEPLWILPQYRQDLLDIIERLKVLPFSALHLDLEPNQLDEKKYGTQYLLMELLQTIEEALSVSSWPISISLHPRYFDEEKYKVCFGCALQNLDLQEVALMSYVANPLRVVEFVRPILKSYPNLDFVIAQSVESILSMEESYFQKGKKIFLSDMQRLHTLLPEENLRGIYIQSYDDYTKMKR